MKKILLALTLVSLLLQGSTCNDSDFVFSGNIDVVSDAAVTSCDAYLVAQATGHTCLLLVNPFQKALRVFDITDNQFLLAPIAYFPLAVSVGQLPTKIATQPAALSATHAIVLDTQLNQIFPIATKNEGKEPSFTSPSPTNGIAVSKNATLIATGKVGTQLFAFVASATSQDIEIIQLDEKTGKESVPANRRSLSVGTDIVSMQFDSSTSTLMVSGTNVAGYSLPAGTRVFNTTPESSVISNFAVGKIGLKTGERKLLLGFLSNNKKAILYDLSNAGAKLGELTLAGTPVAGYIPEGVRENCCNNNPEPWAAVLTDTGELQYINLQAVVDDRKDNAGAEDKIGATVIVSDKVGVPASKTANPIGIFGVTQATGNPKSQRKMLLVYSSLIASVNEGDIERFKRIDGK